MIDRKEPELWHSMDENPVQHGILNAILESFLQAKSVSTLAAAQEPHRALIAWLSLQLHHDQCLAKDGEDIFTSCFSTGTANIKGVWTT